LKRRFKKGDKVFSLSMRRSAVVVARLIDEPRQYLGRSVDEYGAGHESEDWVYDLIPLQGRDGKRNRDLVRQLEKILRKLEE
jgi:hypothetical protein